MTAPPFFPQPTAPPFFPLRLAPDDVPPAPDPGPAPVVLLYGDSFTHQGTWPQHLSDLLRVSVGNNAAGGSGFVQVGSGTTFPHAVTTRRADGAAVVVVYGGVNEQWLPQSVEAVRLAAVVTLAAARAANPRAVIVLVAPQWPATAPSPLMLAIRDQLRPVAAAAGVTYVDPLTWLVGRPDLIGPDGLHPNELGQRYIAARMAPIVQTALDQYRRQEQAA